MSHGPGDRPAAAPADPLLRLIDDLALLLPAQGPISIFIHHNPLHAFEDQPFEDAVEHAADLLGSEPYLSEARYRRKLAAGRIRAADVEAVLADRLGRRGADRVAGAATRLDLWRAVVLYGVPAASGHELSWILDETSALSHYRTDLPADARAALAAIRDPDDGPYDERQVVRRLWASTVAAARRADTAPVTPRRPPVSHRDWLHAVFDLDIDAWIHPTLIRFLAGYLDQGLAPWAMPARHLGLRGSFLELYGTGLTALCGPWARSLADRIRDERDTARDAPRSIAHSLGEMGIAREEWSEYLQSELLALRGWAGIVRQVEERPDRVPAHEITATLADYLAVRLLLVRAALEYAAIQVGFRGPLSQLRHWLQQRSRPARPPDLHARAWPLFHVAQLCGIDASFVDQWTADQVESLEAELRMLDDRCRRRLLHEAFERGVRRPLYSALAQHEAPGLTGSPAFQAIFCIDEREESFRRHLEEVDPGCETFGTAGFFNVAMYHQGVTDAHPRPLCPVAIRPDHYVAEIDPDRRTFPGRSRRLHRQAAGLLGYNVHLGSRLPVHGAVLMTAIGWLALVPLVLRVVFPWLSSRWRRTQESATAAPRTRLQIDRQDAAPPLGRYTGFTVREMADIVRRVLDDIGVSGRLSPLVLVVGHGSVSLNNPHESAHDCGACGGGRGGPNARAFAQMANDPRVRALLAAEGLAVPPATWFLGAQRNTCNNAVVLFDEPLIPAQTRPLADRAAAALETSRRREAHERCRRFDAVPAWYPPAAALAHVEGRAADLAQPRPEYGHATNAFAIIGRRARTRGLFLDRRAFLVSYDPTRDDDGAVLARTLAAVVPVVAGISLEYYFSYVDPTGYGCGTKLPHNVTSLLGVMDGAQSDLRTGLPWQMVEIHEPVRLAIVVEADRDRIARVLARDATLARLVRHRWIWLASLDPASGAVWEAGPDGFVPHVPEHTLARVAGGSAAWYAGKRGFLPPVAIASPVPIRREAVDRH